MRMMMAIRSRRVLVGTFLTTLIGMAGSFAACSDSYSNDATSGSGTGPGSGGGSGVGGDGSGGDPFGEDGGICPTTCSNDLKSVINCKGTVLETCPDDKGCANSKCELAPCDAAEVS